MRAMDYLPYRLTSLGTRAGPSIAPQNGSNYAHGRGGRTIMMRTRGGNLKGTAVTAQHFQAIDLTWHVVEVRSPGLRFQSPPGT